MKTNNLEFDRLYYLSQNEFITELTKELEIEFYGKRQSHERMIELKFEELLLKLERTISGESEPQYDLATIEKFRYLRGEMFANLHEKWPVDRMASEVGFSKSRFNNIYKSIYSITPTADLIEVKMNSAKNMLLYGTKKIEEIAVCLGYDNTTHFIRQFKKEIGIPPSEYRKRNYEEK